jgi:hypothetical protein
MDDYNWIGLLQGNERRGGASASRRETPRELIWKVTMPDGLRSSPVVSAGVVYQTCLGGLGRAATGVAFSFATTYALGQVAKRYYAGGRVMSTALLQESFQNLLTPAKQLQTQYLPQIQAQAQSLNMGKVLAMVRGG